MTPTASIGLLDRGSERDVLADSHGVRAGQSRVLVLRGEAGIGKTACGASVGRTEDAGSPG